MGNFRERRREMILGEYIREECYRMKEGEGINISRYVFNEAFPCGWPSIYRTPTEAFLSSMIGSAWGIWRVAQNPETGNNRPSSVKPLLLQDTIL